MKQLFNQILRDKDGNLSLREVITLLYVLMSMVSWVAEQFLQIPIPEHMFYAFISMVAAGTFGYSLEKKSK